MHIQWVTSVFDLAFCWDCWVFRWAKVRPQTRFKSKSELKWFPRDLGWPWRVIIRCVSKHVRLSELTVKIWMKIDLYCQRQRC